MTLWLSSDNVNIEYNGGSYNAHPILNNSTVVAHLLRMSLGVYAILVKKGHQWGGGAYEGIVLMRNMDDWRHYIAQSPNNPDRVTVDLTPYHTSQL